MAGGGGVAASISARAQRPSPTSSLFLSKEIKTLIKSTPSRIWSYAVDPSNWTSTAPKANFGLTIESEDGQPATGARFVQREKIGFVYSEVDGVFLSVLRPKFVVWKGKATYYMLFGMMKVSLNEGGVFLMEETKEGVEFSHNVYADFPESLKGWLLYFCFKYLVRFESAVYRHNMTEMDSIKKSVEPSSKR